MLGDEPMSNDFTEYFAGTKVYGDDFSARDIEAWFKDETDGRTRVIEKFGPQALYFVLEKPASAC
jgi:hypothetical protein